MRNKAITFTTSPNKKRKLSLPETSEDISNTQELSSPPDLSTTDPAIRLTSSPSPPAYIPKHLVLEGARKGRSPTPELSTTAASSPTGAYAGLTLDSDGYASGTETAGPNKRRGSLASSGLRGGTSSPIRSSSPAKRRASAMTNDDANMESQDGGSISGNGAKDTVNTARRNSKSLGTRHKREASVDMLAQELDPQSATSSTSSTSGVDGTASSASSMPTSADIPSIDDQINQVQQMVQQGSMREGQKGYIVATKWLNRVLARGTDGAGSEKYGKEAREGTIGPVDNTGINLVTDRNAHPFKDEAGESFVPLAPGLNLGEDFEILPEAAWELIIKWYTLAKGSAIIRRYCHNTSTSETQENLQYELHPPVFTILKLPNRSEELTVKTLKEKDATPVSILASRHELYQTFLKRAKLSSGIDMRTRVRIWRILGGLGGNSGAEMLTPAQSRSNSPAPGAILSVDPGTKLVIEVSNFAGLQLGSQRELVDVNDETANPKYNGHLTLDVAGLRQNEVIVLEEMIGGPGGGEWVSDNAASKMKPHGNIPISVTKSGSTTVKDSLKPAANTSRATSPASNGIMTRGRTTKNGRVRGTVGLSNLGNTCYMNSALQCVRSVEELTHYFLEDKWRPDLNTDNPLGHNGAVAKSYAGLLKDMYAPNSLSSFAPRNFKNVIGKYGPSFSGWQQQDSQEFLLFLLDGLQEDLNRVKKKPYVEKPDSTDEMVHNPAALQQMADKCWDIYKARSDSVITDLFAGMYKSTVICPVCDKVSIIFDPFNNLTLQLPVENLWSKPIFFFPLHGTPISVAVDIDKNASFTALKEYVAGKFPGVEAKRMVVVEIYKNKFYKFFGDNTSISEEHIVDADQIAIYEVETKPTNYPPPKKKSSSFKMYNFNRDDDDIPEGESLLAEKMMVPVYHRRVKESSSKYTQKQVFGAPLFIIVTPEEAKDYDRVLQKVLAGVENMTTRNFLREGVGSQDGREGENDSATEDSDTVVMHTDEADSFTDSGVQSKSLESEDGVIDISIRDGEKTAPQKSNLPQPKSLAPMLRPGAYIPQGVRDLFEMRYVPSNGTEMIPTGLATLSDESRNYATIASRKPETSVGAPVKSKKSIMERISERQSKAESPPSSDEDADDVLPAVQPQAQDSGDDSDGLPEVAELGKPRMGFGTFGRNAQRDSKGLITYSRKGNQSASKLRRDEDTLLTESLPLIRLGESILLDWAPEGYDALFSGVAYHANEEMRGSPTWENVETLPDPELEEKRRSRSSRRKNGITLGDCLDEFGKPEILSESDAWYCPRCKEHRRASKQFELWKSPDILVIHLKRFSAQGRFRDKLDVCVDFPIKGLDLSTRVATQEEGKSPIYDLFAVDNHYGGLGGGHYTACASNFMEENQTWYEYNDSSVSRRSDPQKIVTNAAYLLFYRRRSAHHLGGPNFEWLTTPEANTSEYQPTSRATSQAGEGKRLDDSSHNGSSSALRGVGAAHQVGGGGSAAERVMSGPMRTGVDDDLPAYSETDPNSDDPNTCAPRDLNMEQDEDEDEGISMMQGPMNYVSPRSDWSFDNLKFGEHEQITVAPHTSDNDEDLFAGDNSSTKAAGSSFSNGDDNRMLDFQTDEGTTMGPFGTPPDHEVPLDVPLMQDQEEEPVAEVMISESDEFKLD